MMARQGVFKTLTFMFLYIANINDIKVTDTFLLISSPSPKKNKKNSGVLIKDPANSDTLDIPQLVHYICIGSIVI